MVMVLPAITLLLPWPVALHQTTKQSLFVVVSVARRSSIHGLRAQPTTHFLKNPVNGKTLQLPEALIA
jgi:hypothetical protein